MGELVDERKFLLPRQDPSYENPYGQADMARTFWPTKLKQGGMDFWFRFLEKYGTPWLVGKQPRSSDDEATEKLLDMLEAMIQDAVAVIPDDSSITIVEAAGKAGSAEVYREFLTHMRSEVSIALLGQNQSTEANSTRASAETGLEISNIIRDGDGKLCSAALSQILRFVTDINESPEAPAPTVELSEEDTINIAMAQRDESLTRSGLKLTPKYWKRNYRLQEGDIDESSPVVPAAQPLAPEFAEQAAAATPTQQLALATGPAVLDWVRQLRAMVDSTGDPAELQDALLQAYGDLPTEELTELMGLAFELAHLQGRDAAQGASHG